jgi:hypothetical protein
MSRPLVRVTMMIAHHLCSCLNVMYSPNNFTFGLGLDAESALQTMEFLKGYARGGANRRVILTIHQPSTFM